MSRDYAFCTVCVNDNIEGKNKCKECFYGSEFRQNDIYSNVIAMMPESYIPTEEEIVELVLKKPKYTWNYTEYDNWDHDIFESEDECIRDAIENHGMKSGETIVIGTIYKYTPFVDVDSLLEHIEYYASDACGEVADDWNITTCKGNEEAYDELCNKVTAAVNEYLKKTGMEPDFNKIDDIHLVDIGD